jgi:hypothetical protein
VAPDYDADRAAAQIEQLAAIERRLAAKGTSDTDRGVDFGHAEALRRRGASLAVKAKAEDLAARLRKRLPKPTSGEPTSKRRSLLDPDVTIEI